MEFYAKFLFIIKIPLIIIIFCQTYQASSSEDIKNLQKTNQSTTNKNDRNLGRIYNIISDNRPSDYEYAVLSERVYGDVKEGDALNIKEDTWKVVSIKRGNNGYFGALYSNDKTKQLVLVHRGTQSFGSVIDDIQGIILTQISAQHEAAYYFTKEAVEEAKKSNVHLSTTGHSLGALLAELSVYWCHDKFNYEDINAVTFESPGSRDLIEDKMRHNLKGNRINLDMLDIVQYLSYPNLVNTWRNHIGTVYQIEPMLGDLGWVVGWYTKQAHSISNIANNFEGNNKLKTRILMQDWPLGIERSKYFSEVKFLEGKYSLNELWKNKEFELYYRGHYVQNLVVNPEKQLSIKHFNSGLRNFFEEFYNLHKLSLSSEQKRKELAKRLLSRGISESLSNMLTNFKIDNLEPQKYFYIFSDEIVEDWRKNISFELESSLQKDKNLVEKLFNIKEEKHVISPWNTPYLPEHFVNRSELRNKIVAKLEQSDNKKLNQAILVGLHGLGGVGKTYLALDMIYHPRKNNYSFRGWFTASDNSKLKADYFKLGYELGLLNDGMKKEQKMAIVKNWLNSQENLLLVFDNAPNIEMIEKYLPQKGDVIITSRNYKIPSAIDIEEMKESEAIKLLQNLISTSTSDNECRDLAKKLGYLPLAISQAGAYIEQNKITIGKYLELYTEEQDSLLETDVMPIADKHLPVYVTWNLSLNEIKENDKTGKALELLDILAFCHFVDIPKSLLIDYLYGVVSSKTEIEYHKITDFLRQYSLIKTTSDTIAIHHLVQDWIRSGMEHEKQKIALKKAIDSIKKIYSIENKNAKNYVEMKILIPHMENLLIYSQKTLELITVIPLQKIIADAYSKFSNYNKTKAICEEILAIQENHYKAKNHIEISDTCYTLGKTYLLLGDYRNAKTFLERALFIQEHYHNSRKHVEIAPILARMGQLHLWLGEYNNAKTLLEEALEIQKNHYKTHRHIKVASTLRYLARAYLWLGEYTAAKSLLEEILEIQIQHYETVHHIEISFTLNALGRAYLWLEDYNAARNKLELAYKIQREHYGTGECIDLTYITSDLAATHLFLGNYSIAKDMLEKVLKIQKKHYSASNHSEIVYTQGRLGRTYLNLGNYNMAKNMLEEVLDAQKNYYGDNHPEVAYTLTSLSQIQYILEDKNSALFLIEQANNILQNYPNLNPKHRYILKANNLKKKILGN